MTFIVDRAPVVVSKPQSYEYLANSVIAGTITCSKLICDGLIVSGDESVNGQLSTVSLLVDGNSVVSSPSQVIPVVQQYNAVNISSGYVSGPQSIPSAPFDCSQFGNFRCFRDANSVIRLQGVVYNPTTAPTTFSGMSGTTYIPSRTSLLFLDPQCAPSQHVTLCTNFLTLTSSESSSALEYYPAVVIIEPTGEVLFQQNFCDSGLGVAVFFDGLSFSTL